MRATVRKAARSTRARRSPRGSSATWARPSWAETCSVAGLDRGPTTPGRAGGETTRPTTARSSSSPTTRASRWRCRAEPPITSSRMGSSSALEQARAAAGDKDVSVGGGADAAQQYLAAGPPDEILVSIVPVILGSGARLFDNLGDNPSSNKSRRSRRPESRTSDTRAYRRQAPDGTGDTCHSRVPISCRFGDVGVDESRCAYLPSAHSSQSGLVAVRVVPRQRLEGDAAWADVSGNGSRHGAVHGRPPGVELPRTRTGQSAVQV